MAGAASGAVAGKAKTQIVEKVVEKRVLVDDPEGLQREKEEIKMVWVL